MCLNLTAVYNEDLCRLLLHKELHLSHLLHQCTVVHSSGHSKHILKCLTGKNEQNQQTFLIIRVSHNSVVQLVINHRADKVFGDVKLAVCFDLVETFGPDFLCSPSSGWSLNGQLQPSL